MFPCWDIGEEQLKKTVVYTQALQYWVEKSNLPTLGQPCLLARCVLELQETMEQYMSFSDDTVLDGVAPLEGLFKDKAKITVPGKSHQPSPMSSKEELSGRKQPHLGGLLRNLLHPKYCMRSGQRLELSQICSLVGGKCCTPLSQLPLLDRPFWSPAS